MSTVDAPDPAAPPPAVLPNVTECNLSPNVRASTTSTGAAAGGDANHDAGAGAGDRVDGGVTPLSDRQLAAVSMFASGSSVKDVADALGVTRQTLWRWRTEDEHFRAELRRRQAQMWEEQAARLRGLLEPSIDVVTSFLTSRYDQHRFRAATTILRLSRLNRAVPLPDDR